MTVSYLPAVLAEDSNSPANLVQQVARARAYIEASRSIATRRAYASDWAQFTHWCNGHCLSSLPASPATVILFITAMKDGDPDATPPRSPKKVSTLSRYLAAINDRHKEAEQLPPGEQDGGHFLRKALAGIRNTHGVRPLRKAAADGTRLSRMLAGIVGDDVRSVRDRALLAIGMAAALRRSEIVAFTLADIQFVPEGLRLFIARSKTDQAGRGVWVAVPEGRRIRPKKLLAEWLRAGRITEGPVFRKLAEVRVAVRDASGRAVRDATGQVIRERLEDRVQPAAMSAQGVANVVKARAAAVQLDATLFSGHSLRSGFLTEAARQPGANVFKMREVSRHKSLEVLAGYVREHDSFRNHAGEDFL